MTRRPVLFLLAVALLLPGCYAMDIDATTISPHVYMTPQTRDGTPARVGEINTSVTGSWILFGLVNLKDPDIARAIEREIMRQGGSGVTGLEIVTQQTFIDGLLATITLNLYGQRTTHIRGTVVR